MIILYVNQVNDIFLTLRDMQPQDEIYSIIFETTKNFETEMLIDDLLLSNPRTSLFKIEVVDDESLEDLSEQIIYLPIGEYNYYVKDSFDNLLETGIAKVIGDIDINIEEYTPIQNVTPNTYFR